MRASPRSLARRIVAFGRNAEYQVSPAESLSTGDLMTGEEVLSGVSAGHYSSGALTSEGRAWVWGRDASGMLGQSVSGAGTGSGGGGAAARGAPPAALSEAARFKCREPLPAAEGGSPDAPRRSRVLALSQLALGQEHAGAVTLGGRLYACGQGREGQLGTGGAMGPQGSYHGGQQAETVRSPTPVSEPFSELGDSVCALSLSRYYTLVLGRSGAVYATGSEFNGALGVGTSPYCTSPCLVLGLPDPAQDPIVRICAGLSFNIAISASGRVWFWGTLGHGGAPGVVGSGGLASGASGGLLASFPALSGSPIMLRAREPMELALPGWDAARERAQPAPHDGRHVMLAGWGKPGGSAEVHAGPGASLQVAAGLHHAAITDGRRLWVVGMGRFGPSVRTPGGQWQTIEGMGPHAVPLPGDGGGVVSALACGPYSTSLVHDGVAYTCGRMEHPALLGALLAPACTSLLGTSGAGGSEGASPPPSPTSHPVLPAPLEDLRRELAGSAGASQQAAFLQSQYGVHTGSTGPLAGAPASARLAAANGAPFLVAPRLLPIGEPALYDGGEGGRVRPLALAVGAAHLLCLVG